MKEDEGVKEGEIERKIKVEGRVEDHNDENDEVYYLGRD